MNSKEILPTVPIIQETHQFDLPTFYKVRMVLYILLEKKGILTEKHLLTSKEIKQIFDEYSLGKRHKPELELTEDEIDFICYWFCPMIGTIHSQSGINIYDFISFTKMRLKDYRTQFDDIP